MIFRVVEGWLATFERVGWRRGCCHDVWFGHVVTSSIVKILPFLRTVGVVDFVAD